VIRGPTLDARQLVFGRHQLTWARWTDVWQSDGRGKSQPAFGPPDGELTPRPRAPGANGPAGGPVPPAERERPPSPGPPGPNGSAVDHTEPRPPGPGGTETRG